MEPSRPLAFPPLFLVAARTYERSGRSACIAGGLIEAGRSDRGDRHAVAGVPPVLQAASLKLPPPRGMLRQSSSGVPPVLQAASLKRGGPERCCSGSRGGVPPVLQAASLKLEHPCHSFPSRLGVPPVLQAASLKHAAAERLVRGDEGVPPVLQAASLKHTDRGAWLPGHVRRSACIAGGLIEAEKGPPFPSIFIVAFRLYCRRPH